ncbi:MAG: hypothetical protein ACK5RJ_00100 [Burkholderiales bacterium]|jgi:hypothetical protein|nr:hypothetical protein [Rhodocyclaceae bacterium]MCE2723660.1 hypothetical protein [Betaproteobacteria bacterium]MCA3017327.1 hypothetical protein [Rhodocyclaceae bacterium]MCA3020661.1 hypothetical protein [Rhodocyclaceae bacterium]MCA3026642.1 hypothetical protein [Rhodocyclaceae bacterium]
MAVTNHTVTGSFDFAAALAKVQPTVVTVFGPTLRDAAPAEFQAIAATVLPEDYVTVRRLSLSWGGFFEALGATPLVRHPQRLEKPANMEDAVGVASALGPMREDLARFCRSLSQMLETRSADRSLRPV